ncbi:MAG: polysaccharide deacetylase family protein [Flammeovirgaceae bacterium]|nr:polysaccharide deacetylase family protein [Flammeovirgaceae bacterium]MBE62493.1 polysaccharide deacetylase family protein [Flammeovirgaceae bacterium]|tara:strand:+ start:4319 stop:4942 length:624 start_codon:yes stop_codon:yes gene_type:complete
MRTYFFKNPWWLAKFYHKAIFTIPDSESIYLTFDDGPTPKATAWVLDQLEKYDARATFFLIGRMAEKHPELVQLIQEKGHSIGCHTHKHLSGWQLSNEHYHEEITRGFSAIPKTNLFRPPYGHIRLNQLSRLTNEGIQTVMWSHLAGDFDRSVDVRQSIESMKEAKPGSILVFHDSARSFEKLTQILPEVLDHFSNLRYSLKAIPQL